jgi:hypothetical protein
MNMTKQVTPHAAPVPRDRMRCRPYSKCHRESRGWDYSQKKLCSARHSRRRKGRQTLIGKGRSIFRPDMPEKTTVFPHIGQLLRALITTAGYRSPLVEPCLNKNLDDLALEAENRQSYKCEVLQGIKDAVSKTLAADCGDE